MADGEELECPYYGPCTPWAVDPEKTSKLAGQIVLQLERYGQGVYTPEEIGRIAAGILLLSAIRVARHRLHVHGDQARIFMTFPRQ